MVRRKKTPQERADEQRRYALVAAATTDAELEPFLTDPNQAIRCGVVHRAARERLESEGVEFGEDQMPLG